MPNTSRYYNGPDEDEEDNRNPFLEMIKAIFRWIWRIITFPFILIWRLLRVMNEVRIIVLGLITFIVVTIICIVLIFVFKPPFVWEPLKTYLNNDLQIPAYQTVQDENSIYFRITNTNLEVLLSESELTYLFRKGLIINENSVVGLTDNNMTIYLNTDTKEKPLWIYINSKEDGTGNIAIDKSGFGRFNLPDFISNWISGGFNTVMNVLGKQNRSSSLVLVMNQLLDQQKIPGNLELRSVHIRDKQVILRFGIISN